MKAIAGVEIARPIDEVFAFVIDVTNMPRWVTGVTGARMISETMGPGAHFVLEYNGGWRPYELYVLVATYEPPRVVALQTERGPFAFSGRMELTATATGTEVRNIIEAGPDSVSSRVATLLLGPFLKGSARRRLLRELQALEASIEGDTSLRS